jgi:hypothetical protein
MDSKQNEDLLEPLIDSLELDIKSLIILSDKRTDISRSDVVRRLENSDSEEVREFMSLVKTGSKGSDLGIMLVTLGEFLLSSFLFVAGILFVMPTFSSGNPSGFFLSYYGSALHDVSKFSGLTSLTLVINFLIAIILLISSFYTLRIARTNIRFLFR